MRLYGRFCVKGQGSQRAILQWRASAMHACENAQFALQWYTSSLPGQTSFLKSFLPGLRCRCSTKGHTGTGPTNTTPFCTTESGPVASLLKRPASPKGQQNAQQPAISSVERSPSVRGPYPSSSSGSDMTDSHFSAYSGGRIR